jgi:hypothetical protein
MTKRERDLVLRGLCMIRSMELAEAVGIEVALEGDDEPLMRKKPGPPRRRPYTNRWSRAARRRADQIQKIIDRVKDGEFV